MNEYKFESVIIIKPEIEKKVIDAIIAEVNEKVKNLKVEEIGLKKLAYEVKGNKEGYYLLFNFEDIAEKIAMLEDYYRKEDNILKFITIKLG